MKKDKNSNEIHSKVWTYYVYSQNLLNAKKNAKISISEPELHCLVCYAEVEVFIDIITLM